MAKRCDMRLEIGTFQVRDVVFSDTTRFSDGVLYVDRDEAKQLVMEDSHFEEVDIYLVRPGESTRIINVLDASEPRCKVSGPGSVFPGLLGPPVTVGKGRTHRLANVAVVSTSEPVMWEANFWRDSILDMSGPGARHNLFADTLNLVLELKPRTRFTDAELKQLELLNYNRGSQWVQEYHKAVRVAGLKVAAFLAEATRELNPEQVEVYELGPADPALPRVVYSCQLHFHLVYGQFLGWQPTFLHPNEYMDGIIVNLHNAQASTRDASYVHQNHPVIQELYRLHGKEINFSGVLLYRAQISNTEDKERTTSYAAKLLRMRGIDGVVMTWTGSGNPGMDIMMLCQKCENQGIRTTVLNDEIMFTDEDSGFVHFVPEADAIVSVGNTESDVTLPPMNRVIGGSKIWNLELDPSGPLSLAIRYLYGATNMMGATRLEGVPY
ncbi:MAG: glycine/sarcosine/betaine reductase component B subunit [Dehalococcoidia bacterium]